MLVNIETLVAIDEASFRKRYPDTSFPEQIDSAHVADFGYAVLQYDERPTLSTGETVRPGEIRVVECRATQGWEVIPAPAPAWPTLIAGRRWQAEESGITVGDMPIDTSRDSQGLITGAAVSAMLDPAYSVRWKTRGGFVALNAEQIIALATAVRSHVQSCFDREAELLSALEAGTFAPDMLDRGWPRQIDYAALTVAELRQIAADRGISIPSGAKKADIIELLITG